MQILIQANELEVVSKDNVKRQSASAINGIKLSMSIYPGLIFIIGVACLFFYEINKKMEAQIQVDLEERRTK